MRVRAAESGDFDAVADLLERLGRGAVRDDTREPYRETYARQLADAAIEHLVAEDESGEVVGVCTLHFRERLNRTTPEAWVPDLFVAEHARRRGIASELLEEAQRLATERGCWNLTLESGHQRQEAHELYRAFGMRDGGRYFGKLLG